MSDSGIKANGTSKAESNNSGRGGRQPRGGKGRYNDRKNNGQAKQSRGNDRNNNDKPKRPNKKNRNNQRKGDQLNISTKVATGNLDAGQLEKIKQVKNTVGRGFSPEEIYLTLKRNGFDAQRAVQALTAKPSPWSAVVSRAAGIPAKPAGQRKTAPATNGAQKPRQNRPNGANKNSGQQGKKAAPAKKEPVVVEDKIDPEEMQKAIDRQLKDVQERSNLLLDFKKELSSIHSVCNEQLDKLGEERKLLLEQQEKLQQELVKITQRLAVIDTSITSLEGEKVEKLVVLKERARKQQIEILDGV
mmetsp:Transcript_23419/g.25997  ORF Transcript_23419/g.25997 Transcript_23419/m.25997 type:complete len:302 (-) Transcript_23419:60-965(-)|eukprot:CAMPEP_0168532886 /NCGR_PEP_ID=MMETSP0405-20121227/16644_1 /TAXON_ID=498012 /ORGANISM="Trichosphaerium sp, Strain Am-I-7 wt" /LENGTH=301 /DNA_ID=CAMNT_0008558633 /DNA_START=46 /DNA_END=948 /DNA_ORIENTATION=-